MLATEHVNIAFSDQTKEVRSKLVPKGQLTIPRAVAYTVMLVVLLLAFALRTGVLNELAIYHDEMRQYTHNLHGTSLIQVTFIGRLGTQVAPLIMAKISSLLLGESLFALRWPGIMLSVMSIALIYRLGSWLLERKTGLGTAVLLAISPMAIYYAYMFKGYNGMLFFVLLAYALSIRGLQTARGLWWWLAAASWMMAVYSHLYSALATFGALGLTTIWYLTNRRSKFSWLQTFKTPVIATATGVLVGILASVGPRLVRWLLSLPMEASFNPDTLDTLYSPQNPSRVVSVLGLVRDFTSFNEDTAIWNHLPSYMMVGMAILAVLLAGVWHKRASIAAILSAIVLPYGVYQVIHWVRPDILGRKRYFLYVLPFFLLLVAHFPSAITKIKGARHRLSPFIEWVVIVGIVCLVATFWFPSLLAFYTKGLSGNWRSVAMYLAKHAGPSDLVICERFQHGWDEQYLKRVNACKENLEFWRRANRLTGLYPVLSLPAATDYNLLSTDPRVLRRYANSWLVLTDVPDHLEAQDATGKPYPEWHKYDRTVVVPSPPDSHIFGSLVFYLDLLRTWSFSPESQLFYYARLAQLAAISGNRTEAWKIWERVKQIESQVPEAKLEVSALYEILQKPPLLRFPEHPMRTQMGDAIQFEGYTLYPNNVVKRGENLQLTLFWYALQRPQNDYTIFVHIINAQGEILFQEDFMPTPHTTGWWPGDFVWNERLFTVPESVPPGEYQIITGMYLLATMERLPVTGESVRDGSIVLATLRVE